VISPRKLAVTLTALGCAGLLGCGSGATSSVAPALPPASVSAPPSGATLTPPPKPPPPTGAQSQPNGAAQPPAGQPTAGQPPAGQPTAGQTSPGGAKLPSIGSDPAKALADAGPKGQAYLKALRDAGVPIQPGVEGVYILFAQVTCEAKANGTPRQDS